MDRLDMFTMVLETLEKRDDSLTGTWAIGFLSGELVILPVPVADPDFIFVQAFTQCQLRVGMTNWQWEGLVAQLLKIYKEKIE